VPAALGASRHTLQMQHPVIPGERQEQLTHGRVITREPEHGRPRADSTEPLSRTRDTPGSRSLILRRIPGELGSRAGQLATVPAPHAAPPIE
jgi:hypothetical protein